MGQRVKDRSIDYCKRVVNQAASDVAQNNIEAYNFRRLIRAGIVRPVVDGQRPKNDKGRT